MFDNFEWFMIHTYSGYENKVCENIMIAAKHNGLDDQIVAACVPVKIEQKKKIKSTERKKKVAKNEFILVKEEIKDDYIVLSEAEKKKKEEEDKNKYDYEDVKVILMPSYVCVKIAYGDDPEQKGKKKITNEAWQLIRYLRGVTGFVGPSSQPTPLSAAEVERLRLESYIPKAEGEEATPEIEVVFKVDFEVGDLVTIKGGTFDGFSGTVESIDLDKKEVCITIFYMGRNTPTTISINSVEKV